MEKLAIKRLSSSDLTFLKPYFDKHSSVKQKALNLNSDVFVKEFYPTLGGATSDATFHVDLSILGPGGASEYQLARKIRKGENYKNWRLNGEFVHAQDGLPNRFDDLAEEDLVIIGFLGEDRPTKVFLDYIAASNSLDKELFKRLDSIVPRIASHNRRTMVSISYEKLKNLLAEANVPETHPIYGFIMDEDLSEVVEGNAVAQLRVYHHGTRKMSKVELSAAKIKADQIGDSGEELVNCYLQGKKESHQILDFEWVSRKNAVAPFDFTITENNGLIRRLDVKTTSSAYMAPFHISMAELITMSGEIPYDIYRVYDLNMDEKTGHLRICKDMHEFAIALNEHFSHVPYDARVDSITCKPENLSFMPDEIFIEQK